MKRREFLKGTAGLAAGSMVPWAVHAQTKPCMPPTLQATGGTSASTTCGSVDGLSDWLSRSTAPGVLWATNFDSNAKVDNFRFTNGVGWDPNPAPGSVGSFVRRNPNDGILGSGCLELEQMTNRNMNSYWWRPFNPALTRYQELNAGGDLGPGQEFYLQVRVKTNCGGGGGATGPNGSTGGGGRKVFSVSRTENSYTWQEIVAQDTYYRGVYQMYQGYGPNVAYQSLETSVPPYDFNFQPGSEFAVAPGYCSYSQVGGGNRANCWTWGDNEWITYLMRVVPAQNQVADGTVQVWAWKAGMPGYVKILDRQKLYMRYDSGKPQAFNAVLLWIYETGRTSGPAGQKQWYDQVILSRSSIACPTV